MRPLGHRFGRISRVVRLAALAAAGIGSLAVAVNADAATVRVPLSSRDCTLRSETPVTGDCAGTVLTVGSTGQNHARATLYFPVADYVPANSEVTSADLNLYVLSTTTDDGLSLAIHELGREWDTDASWSNATSTTAWASAGGDLGDLVAPADYVGGGDWWNWNLTDAVQSWVAGSRANNGLLLKETDEANSDGALTLPASRYATMSLRPYLSVTYRRKPVPDPTPADFVFTGQQTGDEDQGIWRADLDGTAPQLIAWGAHDRVALSPDGKSIAYAGEGTAVYIVSLADGIPHLLYGTPASAGWSVFPSFLPSGDKLVFQSNGAIFTIDVDGSHLDEVHFAMPPGVDDPDVVVPSPDGRHYLVRATTDFGPEPDFVHAELFLTDTDGSDVRGVTSVSQTYPWSPQFSPDGRTFAFTSKDDVYTGDIESEGLSNRVTSAGIGALELAWFPNGDRLAVSSWSDGQIHRMSLGGVDEGSLLEGFDSTSLPAFRQQVDKDAVLAARFMPVLRFDSSERWRPLNIESFVTEGNHSLCDPEASPRCSPLTSTSDLMEHDTQDAYIDISGDYSHTGDENDYHSPVSSCVTDDLLDCDTGNRSAMYYRITSPFLYPADGGTSDDPGYRYIDYWMFYRANYFSGSVDFHEGDWEAVTVAPSRYDPRTFDFAAFSQHGTFYSYLRDVLQCEDAPDKSDPAIPGEAGSCGTEDEKIGQRIAVMVANGSHANYTTPCSEHVPLDCRQNGDGVIDRGYDGRRRWGRAFDASAKKLLPLPDADSWAAWSGHWGTTDDPGFIAEGPRSPLLQSVSITCATVDDPAPGCTAGPRARFARATASAPRSVSPAVAASSCGSWAGPGVSVVECDPRALSRSVRAGRLNSRPVRRLRGSRKRRAAAGAGIRQTLGAAIKPGTRVSLHQGGSRSIVMLRVRMKGGKQVLATYRHVVRTTKRAHSARAIGTDSRLRVSIGTDTRGRRVPLLGGLAPQAVQVTR